MGSNVIVLAAAVMVAALVGGAVVFGVTKMGESNEKNSGKGMNASNKAVDSLCKPTTYRDTCVSTLGPAAGNTSDPKELIKLAFQVAKKEITSGLERSNTIKAAKNDPRSAQALDICKEVVTYATSDLERVVNSVSTLNGEANMNKFLEDLKVWMGGAVTYQDVCFDAFDNCTDLEAGRKMREFFKKSKELTSNALALMDELKQFTGLLDFQRRRRRSLLGKNDDELAGELPEWLSDHQRKILDKPTSSIKPDIVVAQDGSGKYKTITEAMAQVPEKSEKPIIIFIKAGTYKEYVTVDKKQYNVVFLGEGATKTILTGSKSFTGGYQTFKTCTLAVLGEGFMAKDIGVENTAGPEGHQAVAIRVTADHSVFYQCEFNGYQDTLYAVRSRQFYRDCTVSGTIDFIFGDAQVVFQNCKMVIRQPMEKQNCMLTAQGRTDPHGPGVTVIQNCTIEGTDEFMNNKGKNKAYLGRPWKEYSRTIIMQSSISNVIDPQGWTEWEGDFALSTLFYAEYQNRGPGSNQATRIKWPGLKKLTPNQASYFTPEMLYEGSTWITPTGSPYNGDMLKV